MKRVAPLSHAAYSEPWPGSSGGGAPPLWHATTIMHMRATGRRYLRELSLKTLEIIVEGAELDAATQAQIFDPLKQLAAYLG